MVEMTALHLQLPATKLPVRAEEVMKSEKFMLGFIQKALADQTKIGDILFIPSAPDLTPVLPADDREPRLADVFLFLDAKPESGVAGPKYTP
jgi:hypothetical protein